MLPKPPIPEYARALIYNYLIHLFLGNEDLGAKILTSAAKQAAELE